MNLRLHSKALFSSLLFLCYFATGAKETKGLPISYSRLKVSGIAVDVVQINLNKKNVKIMPVVSQGFPQAAEPFINILSRYKPTAAINGTYFCKVSYKPVGDIVIFGELVNFGSLGMAICFTADKKVDFVTVKYGQHMEWSKYESVVAAGPRLVNEGKLSINAKAEGFRDPFVFRIPRNRSAICLTAENKLILATVKRPVTLPELARIMKVKGKECYESRWRNFQRSLLSR